MKDILRVIKGSRITLPKEYREKLDLREGDFFIYEITHNLRLILTPIEIIPKRPKKVKK